MLSKGLAATAGLTIGLIWNGASFAQSNDHARAEIPSPCDDPANKNPKCGNTQAHPAPAQRPVNHEASMFPGNNLPTATGMAGSGMGSYKQHRDGDSPTNVGPASRAYKNKSTQ
jgi:hypothetical protein